MDKFPTFTDDLKSELKWLEENKEQQEKVSGLKQQKFLLFYNLFLKVENKDSNFTGLCAWNNGPVYTQVHAAVKHHYTIDEIINSISSTISIDESLAKIAKFVIELLTEEEVSDLTHNFDFWQVIDNNYGDNEIDLNNLSKEDEQKVREILNTYDIQFINSHKIYKTKNATFFINKRDYDLVLEKFSSQLENIANDKPIKIELDNSKLLKEETKKIIV